MRKEDVDIIFNGERWVKLSKKYQMILKDVMKKVDEHNSFKEQFRGREVSEYIEKYTDSPLYQYLNNLNHEEVKVVKTVMYVGRDKDHNKQGTPYSIFKQKYDELELVGRNKKSIDIELILGKNPLKQYIFEGMCILNIN